MTGLLASVRHEIYAQFVARTTAPSVDEVADALGAAAADVRGAFHALADGHAIVLGPGSDDILMAHPLSAVPTPFRVHTGGRAYWPNCAWDALGVVAMLGGTAHVEAWCGDCAAPLDFDIADGELHCGPLRLHFAVPPRRWWEDIAFT